MDYNRAEVMGNLTRDVELRYTATAAKTPYVFFSVATNNVYIDKSTGEKVSKATYHDCVAYNKIAETIAKLGRKGKKVFVVGRIEKQPKEEGQVKYWVTRILVQDFIMCSPNPNPGAPTDDEIDHFASAEVRGDTPKAEGDKYGIADMDEEISIEDVPF